MQKVSDPPETRCPICHQEMLKRLISAAGFQLKGTGWYKTDFRDKGKPKPQKPEAESEKKKEPPKPKESESKEK